MSKVCCFTEFLKYHTLQKYWIKVFLLYNIIHSIRRTNHYLSLFKMFAIIHYRIEFRNLIYIIVIDIEMIEHHSYRDGSLIIWGDDQHLWVETIRFDESNRCQSNNSILLPLVLILQEWLKFEEQMNNCHLHKCINFLEPKLLEYLQHLFRNIKFIDVAVFLVFLLHVFKVQFKEIL